MKNCPDNGLWRSRFHFSLYRELCVRVRKIVHYDVALHHTYPSTIFPPMLPFSEVVREKQFLSSKRLQGSLNTALRAGMFGSVERMHRGGHLNPDVLPPARCEHVNCDTCKCMDQPARS